MKLLIPLFLLTISCSTRDRVKIEPLLEPPPLRVDKIRTDSSKIETRYFEDLNSIREFNELDSFEIIYYKDFYFKTKKIRESGMMIGGDQKGIWTYYDTTGTITKIVDFGKWDRKMHAR